jgi:hypothetical protein
LTGGGVLIGGAFDTTEVSEKVALQVRGPIICVWPNGAQSPTNPMNV